MRERGWHDPGFVALCDAFAEGERAAAGRHPLRLVAATLRGASHLPALARLPRTPVALTDGPEGVELRRWVSRRRAGLPVGRLCVAALEVPDDLGGYLSGSHRQALRTNLHRAREAGVGCRTLTDRLDIDEAMSRVTGARGADWHAELASKDFMQRWMSTAVAVVASHDGVPVAFSALLVDRSTAYVIKSQSVLGHPPGTRYLLHLAVLSLLAERGVDVLLVDNVLQLPPGLRYFQRRLGFAPANLRLVAAATPEAASTAPPGPRLGGLTCATPASTG